MKLFFLLLLLSTSAFGRWATRGDLPYVVLNEHSDIKVKKDGTYSLIQTLEYEVLKDAGKQRFSLYEMGFDSSTTKITFLEAKVINQNKETKASFDKIVERFVSKEKGISSEKVVQLPLPNIQVGSRIYLKFKMDISSTVVAEHFSVQFRLGEFNQADESTMLVESEMPLNVQKSDPFKVLSFNESKKDNKYFYEVKLNEPYLKLAVEEASSPSLSIVTFIRFGSDKDWKRISNNMKDRFEKKLSEKLPVEYETLIAELQKYKSLEDKVNHLLAHVTKNYNYLGDWQTLDGSFSPRSLQDISKTKFGDCKDFSVITAAILRKLNLKADIALVTRGTSSIIKGISYDLPSMELFNHAIVRLQDKGKVYWIDPTNKVSYGLNHREDIGGRPVLALNGLATLETIPLNNLEKNSINIKKIVNFNSENSGDVVSEIQMSGVYALAFAGKESDTPKEKLNEAFVKIVSLGEEEVIPEISNYDLKSGLYKQLNIKVNYTASKLSVEEDGKRFAALPGFDPTMALLLQDTKKWVGDLYIGEQLEMNKEITLNGIYASRRPKGCNISTDWVDYRRKFDFTKSGIKLTEHLHFKKELIEKSKFSTTDFELLQFNLYRCASQNEVQFKWNEKKHAESEEDVEKRFAGLPLKERIAARIQYVRDVRSDKIETGFSDDDMIFFLQKNIKDNPADYLSYRIWSHIVLDAGYLNGYNYNRANILESQKILSEGLHQIPNNIHLLVEFYKTQFYLGEVQLAKDALARMTTSDIDDSHTLVSLAGLHKHLGDTKNAFASLALAMKHAKNDYEKSSVWFRLATTYSETREYEKCVSAYNQTLKYDPKDSYTHINVINCLISLKRYDEAVTRARKGLEVTKAGMMHRNASHALMNRAADYFQKGKIAEAEKDLKESLLYHKHSYAFSMLAKISIGKKDFDRSIDLIKEGLKFHEGDSREYLQGIGSTLLRDSPDHYMKLTYATIDLSQNLADKLWGMFDLARMLHKQKKMEELFKHLDKAIALAEPNVQAGKASPDVLFPLGALYSMHGNYSNKLPYLEKAHTYLSMAKSVSNEEGIGFHLDEVNRRIKNIKSGGRAIASDSSVTMGRDMSETTKALKPGQYVIIGPNTTKIKAD